MKKNERKESYTSIALLLRQHKHKEAYDALCVMCGDDVGRFILAEYPEEVKPLEDK